MNRLIILGNGFDLAHGLDTRYNDFILWYLKKCFNIAAIHNVYEDEILSVEKRKQAYTTSKFTSTISKYIDYLYRAGGFSAILENQQYLQIGDNSAIPNPFLITIKYEFPIILLSKCNFSTWVEVENEYYEQLKQILHSHPQKTNKKEKLNSLNNSLSFIINQLEEYLKTVKCENKIKLFEQILSRGTNRDEILSPISNRALQPKFIKFLNFNYTSTIEQYLSAGNSESVSNRVSVNYIHGKLDDPDNPIIFGFGDELDADYAKMEREKIPGYFKHIKSFGYFKTSNYYNLMRFLDSDGYQVFILGHSCGLSDRTMLNMIFEHDNCKSIKIYYYEDEHGVNNFTPLTEEISRHFKDKAMMRRKIVPFDKSSPMPQIK